MPLPNEVPAPTGREFGSGVATKRVVVFARPVRQGGAGVCRRNTHQAPFFLYLAFTHAARQQRGARTSGMEVPDYGPYANEDWPDPEKGHAAMITPPRRRRRPAVWRSSSELGIDEKTIVFFTSDNGPHKEGGADPEFFHSSGPLQGIKRSLHDGGIRVPMIVRWPGHIARRARPAICLGLSGTCCPRWPNWPASKPPAGIDGISVVPTLLGQARPEAARVPLLGVPRRSVAAGRAHGTVEGHPQAAGRAVGAVRPAHRPRREAQTWRRIIPTSWPRSRPI